MSSALFSVALLLTEPVAAQRLAAIEAELPTRPPAEALVDLDRLADDAAGTTAAGRALVLAGGLLLQGRDLDGAQRRFARALATAEPVRSLAARGLGDVAFARRSFGEASAWYGRALAQPGRLRDELRGKRTAAERLRAAWWGEWAAWIVVAVAVAAFAARRVRGAPPVPREVLFTAPLYAAFVAAGIGRDPRLLPALAGIALGSSALLWAWGRAQPTVRGAFASVAACTVAHAALIYAACHRAHFLDAALLASAFR